MKNIISMFKKLIFPDHYKFSHLEIKDIIDKAKENLHIIMTEKDFYKVNKFEIPNINYLKVSLEILKKMNFKNSKQSLCLKLSIIFPIFSNLPFFFIVVILRIKISRKIFANLFSFFGPVFKSKKIINNNIQIFSKDISSKKREKIINNMWKNYGTC